MCVLEHLVAFTSTYTENYHLLQFYSIFILKVRGGLEFSFKETSGQFQESL